MQLKLIVPKFYRVTELIRFYSYLFITPNLFHTYKNMIFLPPPHLDLSLAKIVLWSDKLQALSLGTLALYRLIFHVIKSLKTVIGIIHLFNKFY